MRTILLGIISVLVVVGSAVFGAPLEDVAKSPSCRYCGMDREKFNYSRMIVEYEDGTMVGTCSIHCMAVELANAIDKTPVALRVGDYETKTLLDAEKAVWVMGGNKSGVMTSRAKWAFANREAADRYTKANGGTITTFDEAIKASYDDMYQDTKMIRDRRKMKRLRQQAPVPAR
jgi:nitrous oxide reductase accessory protein NosL